MEECIKFQTCNAPMCPENPEVENFTWMVGEDTCHKNYEWVVRQRKISRKAKEGYYTLAMLKRDCIVNKNTVGLNPEEPEAPQLKKWMKAHPVKRERSEEEKAKLRESFRENVLSK